MIQLLNSKEINKEKWDACIKASEHNLFYFLYDVIDVASNSKWEALIEDDYKNIFPLPYNTKFGLKYYYTPFWIQRLGWLNQEPENFKIEEFIKASYIDLYIQNNNSDLKENRANYVLNLNTSLTYSSNTKRNLKKAIDAKFEILETPINSNEFVAFFKTNKGINFKNIPDSAYQKLSEIISNLSLKHEVFHLKVVANNKILNQSIFIKYGNRFTYFKGCGIQETKNTGIGHLVLDFSIQKAKELGCTIFDFYGGNDPGMSQFYSGFGALKEDYKHLLKNNLPKPLRWLKKY